MMLHTFGLVVLGLCCVVVLSVELESLGLRYRPVVARIVATACVVVVAYTHIWVPFLVVLGVALALTLVFKDLHRRART